MMCKPLVIEIERVYIIISVIWIIIVYAGIIMFMLKYFIFISNE